MCWHQPCYSFCLPNEMCIPCYAHRSLLCTSILLQIQFEVGIFQFMFSLELPMGIMVIQYSLQAQCWNLKLISLTCSLLGNTALVYVCAFFLNHSMLVLPSNSLLRVFISIQHFFVFCLHLLLTTLSTPLPAFPCFNSQSIGFQTRNILPLSRPSLLPTLPILSWSPAIFWPFSHQNTLIPPPLPTLPWLLPPLPTTFNPLLAPFQALECVLANVPPHDSGLKWTPRATKRLEELQPQVGPVLLKVGHHNALDNVTDTLWPYIIFYLNWTVLWSYDYSQLMLILPVQPIVWILGFWGAFEGYSFVCLSASFYCSFLNLTVYLLFFLLLVFLCYLMHGSGSLFSFSVFFLAKSLSHNCATSLISKLA